MSDLDGAVPPVVCTLTLGKRAERELEWGDLASLALTQREIEGGVASTFPLAIASQIEDLANREISCCGSWLEIAHERDEQVMHLALTTRNPEGLAMIRSLSGMS